MEAKQDFDNASKMIKSELARFEEERVEDFKNALMAFLDGMITKQKEVCCTVASLTSQYYLFSSSLRLYTLGRIIKSHC